MPEYAVAITFPQNTTYEALSKLSAATGGFGIRSAAIVERDKDGHLHVPEGGDTTAGAGPMGKSKRQSGNWPRVAGEGETGRSPRSGPDS